MPGLHGPDGRTSCRTSRCVAGNVGLTGCNLRNITMPGLHGPDGKTICGTSQWLDGDVDLTGRYLREVTIAGWRCWPDGKTTCGTLRRWVALLDGREGTRERTPISLKASRVGGGRLDRVLMVSGTFYLPRRAVQIQCSVCQPPTGLLR